MASDATQALAAMVDHLQLAIHSVRPCPPSCMTFLFELFFVAGRLGGPGATRDPSARRESTNPHHARTPFPRHR